MLNLKLKGKKLACYVSAFCLLAALTSFAHGGYILTKAHFAQFLLNKAWQQQTVEDNLGNSNKVKPWPWADIYPVAKLSFDRFNITQIVLNNDSGQALAFGPGLNRINITNIKSESSSVFVISAHNDTHFSILSELQLNDSVTLTLKSGRSQTFKVSNTAIMDIKTDQLVLFNNYGYRERKPFIKELVLVTCYPFHSVNDESTLRYIVYLS